MIINIIRALRFLRLTLSCFGLSYFDVPQRYALRVPDLALRVMHQKSLRPGKRPHFRRMSASPVLRRSGGGLGCPLLPLARKQSYLSFAFSSCVLTKWTSYVRQSSVVTVTCCPAGFVHPQRLFSHSLSGDASVLYRGHLQKHVPRQKTISGFYHLNRYDQLISIASSETVQHRLLRHQRPAFPASRQCCYRLQENQGIYRPVPHWYHPVDIYMIWEISAPSEDRIQFSSRASSVISTKISQIHSALYESSRQYYILIYCCL